MLQQQLLEKAAREKGENTKRKKQNKRNEKYGKYDKKINRTNPIDRTKESKIRKKRSFAPMESHLVIVNILEKIFEYSCGHVPIQMETLEKYDDILCDAVGQKLKIPSNTW